jgi:hypothetical protein
MTSTTSSRCDAMTLGLYAAITALSWPLVVAGLALAFSYHGRAEIAQTALLIGAPIIAVMAGGAAAWLRLGGRVRVSAWLIAGMIGGSLAGGALLTIAELVRQGTGEMGWSKTIVFVLGAIVRGTVWSSPVAGPVGAAVAASAFAVARSGMYLDEPQADRPRQRKAQTMALVLCANIVLGAVIGFLCHHHLPLSGPL